MEKRKWNRKYIILITILIVYCIIMFLIFGVNYQKKEHASTVIAMSDNTTWAKFKNNWKTINGDVNLKKYNWQKFNVFIDNKSKGKYYLWYSDKWYTFNLAKKAINFSGNMIAIKANYKIKKLAFTTNNITDYSYVNKVLTANDLPTDSELTVATITSVDFDQDGSKEDFYFISNAFPVTSSPTKIFTFVFMVKDNNYTMIYQNIDNHTGQNGCKPYLSGIYDVDNDSKYEMILSCGYYSIDKPLDMLYKYNNKKFDIIISNQ